MRTWVGGRAQVRTYNYHRDEVTDHRARVTVKNIAAILRGALALADRQAPQPRHGTDAPTAALAT